MLDFWKREILFTIGVQGCKTHQHAYFIINWSIGCEDIKIFRFFKMAAAAILYFRYSEFLFAAGICGSQTHHCTKFRQNRLFHRWDITIFRIFKMAAAAIWDFWNRKILLVIRLQRVETHQLAKFCQNRSIGCEDIKIFDFSRWRPPPSCIFEMVNFCCCYYLQGPDASLYQISSKSVVPLRRYCFFGIFKMAAAAILDFWNREILLVIVVQSVETHQHAKFRQNRSISCKDIKTFRFFKMAAVAILDFRNHELLFDDGIWRAQTHHCTKYCQNRSLLCRDIVNFAQL